MDAIMDADAEELERAEEIGAAHLACDHGFFCAAREIVD